MAESQRKRRKQKGLTMKKYVYKVQFGEYIRVYQDVDAIVVSDKPLDEQGIIEKIEKFDYDIENNETDWNRVKRDELYKVFNYTEIKDEKWLH